MKRKSVKPDREEEHSGPQADPQEYREKLVLDRDNLDEAALQQASLYEEVGEQRILAVSYRDELEYQKDQLYAELDAAVREEALEDEKKITEAAIKAKIAGKPEMMRLQKKFMAASRAVSQWQLLERAFDQRLTAMKILAQQYASGYFTRSGITAGDEKAREERRARMPK